MSTTVWSCWVFFWVFLSLREPYCVQTPAVTEKHHWLRTLASCWLCDFHQLLTPESVHQGVSEMRRISFHSFPHKNAVGCFVLIKQIITSRCAPYGFPYIKSDLLSGLVKHLRMDGSVNKFMVVVSFRNITVTNRRMLSLHLCMRPMLIKHEPQQEAHHILTMRPFWIWCKRLPSAGWSCDCS